jgi:hypothetical protein
MKLSDAMVLGRVLMPKNEWDAGCFHGCAIGAALKAVGKRVAHGDRNLRIALNEWPWLLWPFPFANSTLSAEMIISSIFAGQGLDATIEWVKEHEPRELEPVHESSVTQEVSLDSVPVPVV